MILYDTSVIGYAQGVTFTESNEIVKEYAFGDDDPSVIEYGRRSHRLRVDKMWVDATYVTLLNGKTKFTFKIRPKGTGGGLPEYQISNCVLSEWELSSEAEGGVVMERLTGEGVGLTITMQ